ncbi:hypothetical protein HF086_007179 [Spodoptera exigua]|uniref:Uncharacterized protein n=1 Tax=Spodoptera exigua TaxID=7107 RepID=A0A922SF97_SPOEX|nr:hypothetical protein HF086_007179 [Spodoptera exigua]
MSQFPLFRLATLLARQLTVPFASKIKVLQPVHRGLQLHTRGLINKLSIFGAQVLGPRVRVMCMQELAVNNPRFRRYVCVATGRVFHACQLRMRLWTLALRQPRVLPPISEQAALDSGAKILVFEVNRQANKQDDKVLEEASQWLALLLSLEELQRELELQQQDINRLQATLRRLAPTYFPRAPLDADQPMQHSSPKSKSATKSKPTAEFDAECPPSISSEYSPSPNLKSSPLPTSECPPPPTSECPPPPTSESPPPSTSECPPPPTSECECPPPPKRECVCEQ